MKLIATLFLLFFSLTTFSQVRQLKSLQVIKFDNYDEVEGEQVVFEKTWKYDSTGKYKPLKFDLKWAIENLKFPHQKPVYFQSDTSSKAQKVSGAPIPGDSLVLKKGEIVYVSEYPPVKDKVGRVTKYNAGRNIHYQIEYLSNGNIRSIKRLGAKHVTAQVTFIYELYPAK